MLSMHDNEEFLFEALRVGAAGYVLKSSAESDLVNACRTAMRGEPFLYPKAVGALVRDYLGRVTRGELAPGEDLSPRETRSRQADRGGPHEPGDRRHPLDQRQHRRAPSPQRAREARPSRPRRTHAVRGAPRPRSTLRVRPANRRQPATGALWRSALSVRCTACRTSGTGQPQRRAPPPPPSCRRAASRSAHGPRRGCGRWPRRAARPTACRTSRSPAATPRIVSNSSRAPTPLLRTASAFASSAGSSRSGLA